MDGFFKVSWWVFIMGHVLFIVTTLVPLLQRNPVIAVNCTFILQSFDLIPGGEPKEVKHKYEFPWLWPTAERFYIYTVYTGWPYMIRSRPRVKSSITIIASIDWDRKSLCGGLGEMRRTKKTWFFFLFVSYEDFTLLFSFKFIDAVKRGKFIFLLAMV